MFKKRVDEQKAKQPVFETDNISEKDETSRKRWSDFALKAILSINVHDDIEVKPLTEAEVEDCCRRSFASGLTPGGLHTPFDR